MGTGFRNGAKGMARLAIPRQFDRGSFHACVYGADQIPIALECIEMPRSVVAMWLLKAFSIRNA